MSMLQTRSKPTRGERRRRYRRNTYLWRLGLAIFGFTVWQQLSVARGLGFYISDPHSIAQRELAWIADGTLWFHTSITMEETLIGFFCGALAGVVAGFLMGPHRALGEVLDPFIIAVYSIPKVALAPLFIVWFGIGIEMKIILATVTVFFIVFFNTVAGVRNVDPDLIDVVRLMGGSPRTVLLKVIVPHALGSAFIGARIAIPYALVGAVVGELIASNRGIGYLISSAASQFDTAGVFAALIVLSILAALLNAVVEVADRRTSRWKISHDPSLVR